MHSRKVNSKSAARLALWMLLLGLTSVGWATEPVRHQVRLVLSTEDNEGLNARLDYGWRPMASGDAVTVGEKQQIISADQACLDATLEVVNRTSRELSHSFHVSLPTKEGTFSIHAFEDEELLRRREPIVLASGQVSTFYVTPACVPFVEARERPLRLEVRNAPPIKLRPPPDHDVLFAERGCDHMLEGEIVAVEWDFMKAGTHVMSRSGRRGLTKVDLWHADVRLRLINRSPAARRLSPPIQVRLEDGRVIDSAKPSDRYRSASALTVPAGEEKEVVLQLSLKRREIPASSALKLASERHAWSLPLKGPVPE